MSMHAWALCLVLAAPPPASAGMIRPHDRLVMVGSTLIEREQRYGYWEAALTARVPGLKVRNLGWSGDCADGIARRAFEINDVEVGRRRLIERVLAEKPSVILIAYGANEAFEGESGVAKFKQDLRRLADAWKPSGARLIFLSPMPMADAGRPLPEPGPYNRHLAMYRDAIKTIAAETRQDFADLFAALGSGNDSLRGLTENGLHLTEAGYRITVPAFLKALGLPHESGYTDDLEPLRQAIRKKNELFFHHWRPQNQTYLFGFRKHEQGKNAKEVDDFLPLIAAAEADIDKLRNR